MRGSRSRAVFPRRIPWARVQPFSGGRRDGGRYRVPSVELAVLDVIASSAQGRHKPPARAVDRQYPVAAAVRYEDPRLPGELADTGDETRGERQDFCGPFAEGNPD